MRYLLIPLLFTSIYAFADPVWHCSRHTNNQIDLSSSESSNEFSIASFSSSTNVIGVSISDLIDVYSGIPVRIGGLPLSACFMLGNESTTSAALTSLGLKPTAIQALAKKSAIIQSHLYSARNNKQMLDCIAQHFPAVGYMSEPFETESVQPCF